MSDSHRNTLEAILYLFNDIINHEHLNKMSVHNMATIMAPNLFPILTDKKRTKQLEAIKEMESVMGRAKDSFYVTRMLILNSLVLFHVNTSKSVDSLLTPVHHCSLGAAVSHQTTPTEDQMSANLLTVFQSQSMTTIAKNILIYQLLFDVLM